MKKATASLITALLITSLCNAQNEGRTVRFGIKLAPNLGYIKPDMKDFEADGTLLGYTFGLMGDFIIGENGNYAFATGLFLNNCGGKYSYPYTYLTTDSVLKTDRASTELRLKYIEVPITLKLKTNEIGYMTYYGQVGFGTAFNIGAKANVGTLDDNGTEQVEEDVDVADQTKLIKLSLVIGGGLEYNFSGNTSLLVGVTYNNGFSNILDYPKDNEVFKDAKAMSNYFELSVGVFF